MHLLNTIHDKEGLHPTTALLNFYREIYKRLLPEGKQYYYFIIMIIIICIHKLHFIFSIFPNNSVIQFQLGCINRAARYLCSKKKDNNIMYNII